MFMKICTFCLVNKDLCDFSKRSGKQSHLYQSRCKSCRSRINSARNKERYHSEPEYRARLSDYKANNPDKVAEWKATEYKNHRYDYLMRAKEWRENHRAERRQISRRYKIKRSEWELNGSFSTSEWDALLEQAGRRCLSCDTMDLLLTQDHVIPLSQGGSNTIDNIQPLCGPAIPARALKL